jgi:hypothetical protein
MASTGAYVTITLGPDEFQGLKEVLELSVAELDRRAAPAWERLAEVKKAEPPKDDPGHAGWDERREQAKKEYDAAGPLYMANRLLRLVTWGQ